MRVTGLSVARAVALMTSTVHLSCAEPAGDTWVLKLRYGRLDRFGGIDIYNNVTRGPSSCDGVEFDRQGNFLRQDVAPQVGLETQDITRPCARTVPMASCSGASGLESPEPRVRPHG